MVQFTDVFKAYENGIKALKDVSFKLDDGEFAFLVGPSGSGKSTIIKLITGEIMPTAGKVSVNGFDVDSIKRRKMPKLRRTIGVIFQDFRLIENKSVYENVAFAMRIVGASNKEIKQRVPYVLGLVGLESKEKMRPNELSGGEQQRVAVARALINNPTPARSLEILMLLEKINELGTTMLVVTHEKDVVNQFSKRVIAIDGGKVISDGLGGYYEYETK